MKRIQHRQQEKELFHSGKYGHKVHKPKSREVTLQELLWEEYEEDYYNNAE